MKPSPDGNGLVPAVSGQDLIQAVPGLAGLCDLEVREFSNIPSCQMTPQKMLELAAATRDALAGGDVRGVVITHGTDTVEETAFLLDTLIDSAKPVVITAAMRGAGDIGADGPHNILCAVRAALAEEMKGLGTVVVLNEQIHAAREVTKTHAANPAAFASPWWGPVGYVDGGSVIIRHRPAERPHLWPDRLGGEVYLLKMTAGDDATMLDYLISRKVDGIVVEGFGRGNVPPKVQQSMLGAVASGIPVVLVSRCGSGCPASDYGYEGGGRISRAGGIIFGGELSGPKARLLLMLALGSTRKPEELQKYFI